MIPSPEVANLILQKYWHRLREEFLWGVAVMAILIGVIGTISHYSQDDFLRVGFIAVVFYLFWQFIGALNDTHKQITKGRHDNPS